MSQCKHIHTTIKLMDTMQDIQQHMYIHKYKYTWTSITIIVLHCEYKINDHI